MSQHREGVFDFFMDEAPPTTKPLDMPEEGQQAFYGEILMESWGTGG
jgi:hypothetical protein